MKRIFTTKYFLFNYGCAVVLTLITLLLAQIPFVTYLGLLLIGLGLLAHYHLTNLFRFTLTVLSFFINFILWTAEQVNIESTYHHTTFYQSEDYKYIVVLLGAFIWVTNKVIIDFVFILFRAETKEMNIELWVKKLKKVQADT